MPRAGRYVLGRQNLLIRRQQQFVLQL